MFELEVKKREEVGTKKLGALRASGFIPGIIYGNKEEPTSIKIDVREFKKTLKEAGESAIITLKGLENEKDVLIHDVDFEPVRGEPRHVDFYAVDKDAKIRVSVPLEFIGESGAVKNLGGVLVKVMYEIEIEVLPRDLPQHIEADISVIEDFSTSLHVSDLKIPESITLITATEEVIASANAAVEESFDEPVEAPDMESIEVEEKGKGDKGEAGTTEKASE